MGTKKSQEVLADKSASGKKRDWQRYKLHSGYISLAYNDIDPKKSKRMKECADWLAFARKEDGSMKLHDARFCRVRLCPICQWRRALKTFAQTSQILDVAKQDGYVFLFLTLTIKNCKGEQLSCKLDMLMEGFNRLTKYKVVQRAVKGWYRGVEVTHNTVTDDYHPHVHVILAVNKSYFSGGGGYLSHAKWTELWRKAMKLSYDPIVNIKKCYGSDVKSIAEACKYAVKPTDILNFEDWDMTVNTLTVLDKALENRRFVGMGGLFKEIHKKLNLEDAEDGDLIHISKDEIAGVDVEIVKYFWNGYNQYEKE